MNTYKNKNYKTRNYYCTNIVCCETTEAPDENWIECDVSELNGLDFLFTENGARYYGHI